jgi:GNAT superfamily N-acetyltransferase
MMFKQKYLEQIKLGVTCTNSYEFSEQVLNRLKQKEVLINSQSKGLFFAENTSYDFWRLYFYIQDISQIEWNFFRDVPLVIEIVVRNSKKELWDSTIKTFQNKGNFKVYDTFNRMFRDKIDMDVSGIDFSIIETAQKQDLPIVKKLLEENFDAYSDRIPSLRELEKLAETIFLIKENNKIVAFFITERKGFTLEFRYWLVLEAYRGKRYGGLLMKRVLTFDPEIKRFISWISQKNKNVILAHEHLGFKNDGLINYVLHKK